MHLITLGDQEEASRLGGRLTGRYPEAIVQGTSLSHPRLVELPAYRRVAVFARICGKRTDVSPLCESDSGKAQRDSPWRDTRTTPAARSPSIPRTTRPPPVSGLPLTVRARLAARSVGARAPAIDGRSRPAEDPRPADGPRPTEGPTARGRPTAGAEPGKRPDRRLPSTPAGLSAPHGPFCPYFALDCIHRTPWGCLTCRYATRRLPAE